MTRTRLHIGAGLAALVCVSIVASVLSCQSWLGRRDAQMDALLSSSPDGSVLSQAVFAAYENGYVGFTGEEAAERIAEQLRHNPLIEGVECRGDSYFEVKFRDRKLSEVYILSTRATFTMPLLASPRR